MIRKPAVALLAALLLLPACEYFKSGPSTETGAQSTAALTADDQRQIDDAMHRAFTAPIGQQVNWANSASGNSGNIIAIKDGYSQQGAYCRDFQKTITAGNQTTKTNSDFCQMPDGSWKAVSK
jgi:surface antigen